LYIVAPNCCSASERVTLLPPHKRSADKAASTSEKVSSDSAFEGVQIVTENASEAIIAEDEKQRSKKPMVPDPETCIGTAFASTFSGSLPSQNFATKSNVSLFSPRFCRQNPPSISGCLSVNSRIL
jgi:hypothetical protein